MKNFFIIGLAIFIDFLQALFMLTFMALQAVTPVGGAIGAAGFCYSVSSDVVSGVINALQCAVVGAGASAFAIPIGAALGVAISVTFGGGLILILAWSGAFYPGIIIGSFVGESLPVLNALIPGWTLLAWRSLHKKKAGEKQRGRSSESMSLTSLFSEPEQAAAAQRRAPSTPNRGRPGRFDTILEESGEPGQPARNVRQPLAAIRGIDGIRPANDNRPYINAKAAA